MRPAILFFALFALLFSGCRRPTDDGDTNNQTVHKVVKVVYFHGNDQEPLPQWRERLNRTLNDVSDYYKEEFSKFGVAIEGIPFERSGGELVIHVVEGDLHTQSYDMTSGPRIQQEISGKAGGGIDFSKDHVLVINGLCSKQPDGLYVFNSPYFGTGSMTNGVCQVADCELLDSKFLNDGTQRMKFSEMAIQNKECSVGEFNSWYVGGIAHEMGHLFGLPHDYGHPTEFDPSSLSLMGMYGSRHYREYLWGGTTSSYFSMASIFQLISHPIFAPTSKSEIIDRANHLSSLKTEKQTGGPVLKVNIGTGERPYGVVALIRTPLESEYFNRSYFNIVSAVDIVQIELGQLAKGNYYLQLVYLFPNGDVQWQNKMVKLDDTQLATMTDLSTDGRVDIQQFYEEIQMMEQTPGVQLKLEILKGILNPPTPIDPQVEAGARLSLSDAKWEKASVGWEEIARNYFTRERKQTFFLELQGAIFSKGLYAHSPSSYVFNLDGKWKTFSAMVGLRDYAHAQGSARFTVIGDGKVLYESAALRTNQKSTVNVDISKVKILELQANGTEGHNFNSWAIWVNPIVER